MQQEIHNDTTAPVQIQQLAEARQMGEFLAAYPRHYQIHPLDFAPLGWPLLAWAAVLTFLVSLLLITIPSAFLWSPPAALLFFVLLGAFDLLFLAIVGIGIFLSRKRAPEARHRDEELHRQDQLLLYRAGFVFLDGKNVKVYRWENIQQFTRGDVGNDGSGIRDIDTMRVVCPSEGDFTLPMTFGKHARAAICDHIERSFVEVHRPQMIEQYNAGAEIVFGSPPDGLSISTTGFSYSSDLLPWSLVEKAEVGSDFVLIRKEGRTSDWYRALICDVPNAALLKALLDYRRFQR